MKNFKYVIIGNSTAATGCIEGIRQLDKEGTIAVVSNEDYHTYSRPLISYLLCGKTTEEKMKYRPSDFYDRMQCTTFFGITAKEIEANKKTISLSTGEKIEYDKLLIATGSRPFVPNMEGLDSVKDKHTFMSLDDAKQLAAVLDKSKKVLIIGAGLIGLKCAEGINKKVQSITVIDLADRILPSILDVKGSKIVQEHIEKQGIKFILNASVKAFNVNTATLSNGERIDFDILIIAVGVRANTEIFKAAGGNINRGIITDERCKTNLKDIYAAGDCSESFDISTNESRVLALLPNAYMQGECAGVQMAGGDKLYDKAIAMNAIGFFGLHMITAGNYDGEEHIIQNENNYKKLITKDGLLKGYIMIGNIERAGIYTALIKNKTHLTTIDFELMKENPQLMAFSKKDRNISLGGGIA